MEAGLGQLPAYTNFPRPVDRGAVVRWNVDLTLRWMINGTAPDEYVRSELHELLRDRAIAGQRIEDSILVYRRGARMFWEALLDLAKDEDRALLIAQSDTVWGYLEDYLDMIVEVFAQAYADQEDVPSTAGDRRARTLFDRLCAQLPVTIEDRDRAARLGFDLTAPYCPFVAQLAGASVAGHADLAARLRTAGALAFTEGVRVTGLTAPGFGWARFLSDPRLVLAHDPPVIRARLEAAADSLRASGASQHAAIPDVQDREADRPVAQGSAGPRARAARGPVGVHFWGRAVCLGGIIHSRRWLGPLRSPGASVPGRAAWHRA